MFYIYKIEIVFVDRVERKGFYMELNFEKQIIDIVDKQIINCLKEYDDIIVFGGGQSGEWTVNRLRENGIFPSCYCDNEKRKQGLWRNSLSIMSFEEAIKKYPKAAICVASMWREEIYRQIKSYDLCLLEHTYDLLLSTAWETQDDSSKSIEYTYIKNHLTQFEKLYCELSDQISKSTLEGILNYRLTRERKYLKAIKSDEIIYIDRTIWEKPTQDGFSIIDGGAYDGDTVSEFIERWGVKAKLCFHCFEADSLNCDLIQKRCQYFSPHQVNIYNKALSNSSGIEMLFYESGYSGRLTNKGEKKVLTQKIDDIDWKRVDFIKLDIEGSERECLEGARNTIEKFHPKMAICVYHLQDDLPVIYKFIKSLKYRYELKLRHYMNSAGDTILYGIP